MALAPSTFSASKSRLIKEATVERTIFVVGKLSVASLTEQQDIADTGDQDISSLH